MHHSKASSKVLLGSLLGGANLNYVAHKACLHRSSADRRKQRDFPKIEALTRRNNLAERTGLNCLLKQTENGAWLTAIIQRLNGMNLSRQKLQDNLLLRYSIVPLNLSTDCDGCVKEFLVPHALSCPK